MIDEDNVFNAARTSASTSGSSNGGKKATKTIKAAEKVGGARKAVGKPKSQQERH